MARRKARANADALSYPTLSAMAPTLSCVSRRRSAASCSRHHWRYSAGVWPRLAQKRSKNAVRDRFARRASPAIVQRRSGCAWIAAMAAASRGSEAAASQPVSGRVSISASRNACTNRISADRRNTAAEDPPGCKASSRTRESTGAIRAHAAVPARSTITGGRPATIACAVRMSATKLAVMTTVRAPPPPWLNVVAFRSRRSMPGIALTGTGLRPSRSKIECTSSRGRTTTSPGPSFTGDPPPASVTAQSPSSTACSAASRPPGN